jgi:hypothetical protein
MGWKEFGKMCRLFNFSIKEIPQMNILSLSLKVRPDHGAALFDDRYRRPY